MIWRLRQSYPLLVRCQIQIRKENQKKNSLFKLLPQPIIYTEFQWLLQDMTYMQIMYI